MRSKTRVGQDPGYCQEEENNRRRARSLAEQRHCLKSSPSLLWMVLPTVCVWKNYYLRPSTTNTPEILWEKKLVESAKRK
ncbi:hypothetical protein EAG_05403 [Camponotus floridanus]|uniref:Uncharacterized protein n=1 Tax=Camponotus floridanus TaxID=104421 RepID=E2A5Y5_CAMFO|nr:hypothetical protein EAG_05403 [Camponotus floridanus]